jgi:hypothetical protein
MEDEKAVRALLYRAIRELDYVQSAEDHSQCASAEGRQIVKEGMELLNVKDLAKEKID